MKIKQIVKVLPGAILLALFIGFLLCCMRYGNTDVMFKSWDADVCSKPIPQGYKMVQELGGEEWAAKAPNGEFVWISRRITESYDPWTTATDTCEIKAVIFTHYEHEQEELKLRNAFK